MNRHRALQYFTREQAEWCDLKTKVLRETKNNAVQTTNGHNEHFNVAGNYMIIPVQNQLWDL